MDEGIPGCRGGCGCVVIVVILIVIAALIGAVSIAGNATGWADIAPGVFGIAILVVCLIIAIVGVVSWIRR